MFNKLFSYYRVFNWLSLDVALGSVIGALFFLKVFGAEVHLATLLILFLTVWIIYTTDHLMDSSKVSQPSLKARYLLHINWRRPLIFAAATAVLSAITCLFFISPSLYLPGMTMAILIAVYLVFHEYLSWTKEWVVAIMYCSGVLLPALANGAVVTTPAFVLVLQYFLVVIANLLLFSYYDHHSDVNLKQFSFVVRFGLPLTILLNRWLLGIQVLLFFDQLLKGTFIISALILMGMHLLLFIMYYLRSRLEKNELFRLIGDGVFYLMALIWLA